MQREVYNFRCIILAKSMENGTQCTSGGLGLQLKVKACHPELGKEKAETVGIDASVTVTFGVGKTKCSSLADPIFFSDV